MMIIDCSYSKFDVRSNQPPSNPERFLLGYPRGIDVYILVKCNVTRKNSGVKMKLT
jgi:hypothetical protein